DLTVTHTHTQSHRLSGTHVDTHTHTHTHTQSHRLSETHMWIHTYSPIVSLQTHTHTHTHTQGCLISRSSSPAQPQDQETHTPHTPRRIHTDIRYISPCSSTHTHTHYRDTFTSAHTHPHTHTHTHTVLPLEVIQTMY